jgi:excisionase family DNA binding protein
MAGAEQNLFSDLLTVRESAKLAGVSLTAIYTAIAEGRLPHQRVLERIAIRKSDVMAWKPCPELGQHGRKGRSGRPKGLTMSEESKARLAASQRARWAKRKAIPAA